MPRFSFGPPDPQGATKAMIDAGYGQLSRDILDNGSRVGTMSYSFRNGGKEIYVRWISVNASKEETLKSLYDTGKRPGGGRFGTAAMKELGAQLRSEGITAVSGNRVSGIRSAQGQGPTEVRVSLERQGSGDDRPRVPAGSPEGGQFTSK